MHKTTIYLDPKDLRTLKMLAAQSPQVNVVTLIRQALHDFLKKVKQTSHFPFLKRLLKRKASATSFGDAVSYQRSLRKEWKA